MRHVASELTTPPERLRAYRADDLDAVVRVFTESVRVLARPYYDEAQLTAWAPEATDLAEWQARLAPIQVLVAESGDRLEGFLGYEPDGHVVLLYTAPFAARRGVASRLYAHVESAWRAAAVKRAFAEVSLAARPFFERHGFVVDEEQRVERRGAIFRRFLMSKAL